MKDKARKDWMLVIIREGDDNDTTTIGQIIGLRKEIDEYYEEYKKEIQDWLKEHGHDDDVFEWGDDMFWGFSYYIDNFEFWVRFEVHATGDYNDVVKNVLPWHPTPYDIHNDRFLYKEIAK